MVCVCVGGAAGEPGARACPGRRSRDADGHWPIEARGMRSDRRGAWGVEHGRRQCSSARCGFFPFITECSMAVCSDSTQSFYVCICTDHPCQAPCGSWHVGVVMAAHVHLTGLMPIKQQSSCSWPCYTREKASHIRAEQGAA